MLSEEQVSQVKREIEQSVPTTMTFGVALSNPFKPWIENARANIDWFYWERYRDYLIEQKGFGSKLVNSLSEVTEKILGLAENPQKPGAWERRGMVVGQVQSGKTSNYLGLITKAADAGYKVFIVIAGVTNSLRKQTQMRVDEGFTYSSGRSFKTFAKPASTQPSPRAQKSFLPLALLCLGYTYLASR